MEEDDGYEEEEEAPHEPWALCEVDDEAESVLARARELAPELARRAGLRLELIEGAPALAAAFRNQDGYQWGVPVVTWHALRVAGEARLDGAPALLVAEAGGLEGERDEVTLRVHVAPDAPPGAAAYVLLHRDVGAGLVLLPEPPPGAVAGGERDPEPEAS